MLFEKATLDAQFESGSSLFGIPTAALRGYSSETLEREIFEAMDGDGRPVVVWYVGDLDPEGEDIERNFQDQAERRASTSTTGTAWPCSTAQIASDSDCPEPGQGQVQPRRRVRPQVRPSCSRSRPRPSTRPCWSGS